jgi:hypothetical protein
MLALWSIRKAQPAGVNSYMTLSNHIAEPTNYIGKSGTAEPGVLY